jgi:Glycosyltransferase Family 4
MRIDLLAEPVSRAVGHVTGLGNALVARGHHVTRVERRTEPRAPACEEAGSGHLRVHRLDAGPPRPLRADERLLAVPELGYRLARDWAVSPPEVVHAHGWGPAWPLWPRRETCRPRSGRSSSRPSTA